MQLLDRSINPTDFSTSEGKIFQEAVGTLAAQPGYQRSYYGLQVDNPSILHWFIDWDDLAAHEAFIASP